MSIKKTTERELSLAGELERLRSAMGTTPPAPPFEHEACLEHVRRWSEAYGTLRGAIEMACLWLEGRQPMMSRAEVASYLRGALARADAAAKGQKP